MKSISFAIAVLALTLSSGCGTSKVNKGSYDFAAATAGSGKNEPTMRPTDLSREMAWLRARQVGKVAYVLWFGLDEQSENYDGRAVVNFELKDFKKTMPAELLKQLNDVVQVVALDFEGGTVNSVSINGSPVNMNEKSDEKSAYFAKRYDGHHLYLHASELVPGANRVEISFTQKFNPHAEGFYRFKDPADGAVYLYTDSEPYNAHRIFPCFDQPDLKASYEVTVEAPEDWQVISNTLERDVTTVDGRKSWAFPPSPVFSTYLFEIAAGPFAMWKSDAGGIPLRLFARQSLKPYVEHQEWFDVTKKGLDFYDTYFGYPYPYAKLDQIIVPDFNPGAMENAAAITFTERMIHRTRPTMEQRRGRADTILHEMAHQWFGDLVTMRWWNGLWLNESFATYMSSKALAEATDFPGAWEDFYGYEKSKAYWEDQLVTTHPIEMSVPDTETAESNFDGITYGKGASVLKQLAFYLGEDDFREGLQRYFMKYALRNTTTHEFIKTLMEASGKDLTSWQKLWLHTAGVNGVRADWSCGENRKISKFDLIQSPAEQGSPTLRPHRTRVALFSSANDGKIKPRSKEIFDVTYSQARNPVPEAIGKPCPSFVFPNYEDYDYVKVELDPASLEFARKNLSRFESPSIRQAIWTALWDKVVDGKLKPQEMLDAILELAPKEKDPDILAKILGWAATTRNNEVSLPEYLPDGPRAQYLRKIETMASNRVKHAAPGSDLQRTWFDSMLAVANSPSTLGYVRALLGGRAKLEGLPIKQPERWSLIYTLARNGDPNASALIADELKSDPTDLGQRAAIRAEAAMPDPANKRKWLGYFVSALDSKVKTDDGIPLNSSRLREAAPAYLSLTDEATTQDTIEPFFKSLPKLEDLSEDPYAGTFARWIYPALCDPQIVNRTSLALTTITGLPPDIEKSLKVHRQELQRCIRARAKAMD